MINRFTSERNSHFLVVIICFVTLYLVPCADCASASQTPVAKVNDRLLTETDLEEALNEIMPAGRFHGGFSSEKRAAYRPEAMEQMIVKELFYQEALRAHLEIDKGLIDDEIERTKMKLGGEEKYKAALKRAGLTQEQHREIINKKYLIKNYLEIEIKNRAKVSDNVVKKYYEENRGKFIRPEARRITHILISVKPNATPEERASKKEEARKVLEMIKSGKDMSQVATDYSDGAYRVKGGDLGLVHKGRLHPDLENEVFKLEPGHVSDLIQTIYGYHIVRVEEVKASEQLPLEEVSSRIKKQLTEENEKQLREALVKRLKAQANIEVFTE